MPEILPTTYGGPAAWKGSTLVVRRDWIHLLDEAHIAELDAALSAIRVQGVGMPQVRREHFLLPTLSHLLATICTELNTGRGFAVLRGLPVERYTKLDAGLIFWGIGSHLGTAAAQNARGDLLGQVRDVGRDWNADVTARGYQTPSQLPFHSDSADIVGLLCLRRAKTGGLSSIVSSISIHDAMVARRPDLAAQLYHPFCLDRRGEEPSGKKPYYAIPIFNPHGNHLLVRYNRTYIESAQRFAEVPRLTAKQTEALDLFDTLCSNAELTLDMDLMPGDMQFLNNYCIVHSRTAYEDFDEPDRKRHLLRLWLRNSAFADLPPAFTERNEDLEAWLQHPRVSTSEEKDLRSEALH